MCLPTLENQNRLYLNICVVENQKSKTIKTKNTAAFQHLEIIGHTFDFENTKILKSERNLEARLIV